VGVGGRGGRLARIRAGTPVTERHDQRDPGHEYDHCREYPG
jgi:hypothetical protein